MPGHYSTGLGSRPCPATSTADTATARFFVCARVSCRVPVLVCRRCDRGQIYCSGTCAQDARRLAQQAAGQSYQATHRGRVKHAARASCYRSRQNIVTHQGSPPQPRDDVVLLDAEPLAATVTASKPVAAREVATRSQAPESGSLHCHWCGERCSPFVRNEFLRRRQRRSSHDRRRGKYHDHPS